MCESIDKYIFCTCAPGTGAARMGAKKLPDHSWRLARFIKEEWSGMMGRVMMPRKDLGEGITEDQLLAQLNGGQLFDFDYQPQEMDQLTIWHKWAKSGSSRISLLYTDGSWAPGMHPAFSTISEELHNGKVFKRK